MSPPAPERTTDPPKPNEEHWSLVSVAFGAVLGLVVSILIKPLVDLLPGKLFEEFLSELVEDLLRIGLPLLFGYLATRTRRLDHFLMKYLATAAACMSALLALSLWTYAGQPVQRWPIAVAAAIMLETWLFLLFCGSMIRTGMSQIKGTQAVEYKKRREADAQRVAEQAIASGDPGAAAGIFGSNLTAEFNHAMASGCWLVLQLIFHMLAIAAVTALATHVLFDISVGWSWAAGAIIAIATTRIITLSNDFGERYSESIPLDEKYKGIGNHDAPTSPAEGSDQPPSDAGASKDKSA